MPKGPYYERQSIRWQTSEQNRLDRRIEVGGKVNLVEAMIAVLKGFGAIIAIIGPGTTLLFIADLIAEDLRDSSVVIQPILVPKALSDIGFTSDVASLSSTLSNYAA